MDAGLAAMAKAAGIPNWWGSGPRPLNMPGAQPHEQSRHIAELRAGAYERAWGGQERRETGTIVLEPTPAQLAQGIRVLYIPETSQSTAMSMMRWAREHGWTARLSRSRYLTEPTNAGPLDRRGRRLEVETLALRLESGAARAYLIWEFDVERGKWSSSGGRCAAVLGGRLVSQWPVSVTGMQVMMGMVTEEQLEERREKREQTRLAKLAVKAAKEAEEGS